MFLFLLPYSKSQSEIRLRDCKNGRFELLEIEPLARSVERELLKESSTFSPLWRRYKNAFWESLEFWVLPPPVARFIEEHSLVPSPVYGLLKPSACLPYLTVSWEDTYKGRKLLSFWKEHLKPLSFKLFKGRYVFNFLSSREASLFDLSQAEGIVEFEYYRKERKVKNPMKHRAYTLRYIAEKGLSLEELDRINFYDYRVIEILQRERKIKVVMRSGGSYEL